MTSRFPEVQIYIEFVTTYTRLGVKRDPGF